MSSGVSYGYAVARCRTMELRLLDAQAFSRLLDAYDITSFFKILSETSYGKYIASKDDCNIDAVLEQVLQDTYNEFDSFLPDENLTAILKLPYDFHNIKVILKSILAAQTASEKRWGLLTYLGSVAPEAFVEAFETERFTDLPKFFAKLCEEIWQPLQDLKVDMLELEQKLDKAMYAQMLTLAEELKSNEIVEWVKLKIDVENLRSLLRLKRFAFSKEKALPFLCDGGNVPVRNLIHLLDEDVLLWESYLGYEKIGRVFEKVKLLGNFSKDIIALECAIDNFLLETIKQSRYSADSPANVLAFLWGKEIEVKNIRVIYVSKSLAQSKEEVRGLLRDGF